MTRFNNYDLEGYPPVLSWNPIVMRCKGCGLDEHPDHVAVKGEPQKHCWHLRACDMHVANPKIPDWKREIKAGLKPSAIDPDEITAPLRRRKPAVIAVQFMGDVSQYTPVQWNMVFRMINVCPRHIFVFLTKWPEKMQGINFTDNCWVGRSIRDQDEADRGIPDLLRINAKHKWVSMEPLMGPVDLTNLKQNDGVGEHCYSALECDVDPVDDGAWHGSTIEFVACGPETGPGARDCRDEWMQSVAEQCKAAGVPFYDKRESCCVPVVREWPDAWKELP